MTSKQLYQLLLENLSTAVLLIDEQLEIGYINPACETILTASAQRLLGTPVRDLFKEPEDVASALQIALSSNRPFTQRQADLNINYQQITIDYTATPVNQGGKTMLILEMLPVDRIIKINREEALLSAHDTSRNLIRKLAHEVKNPLGGIQGAVQLLAEELSSHERQTDELLEYTEIISLEVNRLRNLVDDLLGPNQPPRFAPLNIHEVTEHVASLVAAETKSTIKLVRNYDPSLPPLTGDRERLVQAILNIVRNAVQALQSSDVATPTIELKTRIQRNFTINKRHHRSVCKLEIIDNGPGIPDEIADRVFYPMISGRPFGTGLGLPIAQSAISLHEGLIEYNRVDDKTVFSIYLPMDICGAPNDP